MQKLNCLNYPLGPKLLSSKQWQECWDQGHRNGQVFDQKHVDPVMLSHNGLGGFITVVLVILVVVLLSSRVFKRKRKASLAHQARATAL
jgi:hypothetical protein